MLRCFYRGDCVVFGLVELGGFKFQVFVVIDPKDKKMILKCSEPSKLYVFLALFLLSHFAEVAKQFSKLDAMQVAAAAAAVAVAAMLQWKKQQQCNSASLQWSDHNYSGNYSRGE